MLYGLMADDIERLRQAALKDPAQLVRFADQLVAAGRADEAVAACRKGLGQRPDDVPLRLALGRALMAAGHLEEAQAALLDAVARQQKSAAQGPKTLPDPVTEAAPALMASDDGIADESGPIIADPSIEEAIELPTTVGRMPSDTPATTRGVPSATVHGVPALADSFEDDAPTGVASVRDLGRARGAPEPVEPTHPDRPPRQPVTT